MEDNKPTVTESEAECFDWENDAQFSHTSCRQARRCAPDCRPRPELMFPCNPCQIWPWLHMMHCPPRPCPPPPRPCPPRQQCCSSLICCNVGLPPHRCIEKVDVDIIRVELAGDFCQRKLAVDFCVVVRLIDCRGCERTIRAACRTIIGGLPQDLICGIPLVCIEGKPCLTLQCNCLKVESCVKICF